MMISSACSADGTTPAGSAQNPKHAKPWHRCEAAALQSGQRSLPPSSALSSPPLTPDLRKAPGLCTVGGGWLAAAATACSGGRPQAGPGSWERRTFAEYCSSAWDKGTPARSKIQGRSSNRGSSNRGSSNRINARQNQLPRAPGLTVAHVCRRSEWFCGGRGGDAVRRAAAGGGGGVHAPAAEPPKGRWPDIAAASKIRPSLVMGLVAVCRRHRSGLK